MVIPVLVVGTLTAARVATLLVTYGPAILVAAQSVSTLYTDYATRGAAQAQVNISNAQAHAAYANARAADAHRQAAGAFREEATRFFNQYRDQIPLREVRIPQSAFNSSIIFTEAFVATAVVALLVEIHQGVQALKKIGLHLEDIHKQLHTLALANVQGWTNDGYGFYVHKLIKREIRAERSSEVKHFFYVYNPDTVWHTDFERQLEDEPLPEQFGGYSADLDAIFLLMWTNRRSLIEMDEESGRKAVFHLLLPTYHPYAINDRLIIEQGLETLVIKGYRYGGRSLTYFRLYRMPGDVILQDVENLQDPDEDERDRRNSFIAFGAGGLLGGFIYLACKYNTRPPTRVLGPPTFQVPQAQSST